MSKQPNFLFIITDQHRADHLGCYGNPVVKTPNIDSIAKTGTRFDRFYVANPICMPNRASIMTGRMCSAHGARHNGIPLSKDHTTFVELLRDAGYRTGLIGKSHLQSFTGLPATNQFEPKEGKRAPSAHLQDAYKNNRQGEEYELELVPDWDRPISERLTGDFYGFEHVEIAADHADQASGDYLLWAREQRSDFDDLVGPDNALPDNRINAPQAWRTAVPEELYSTSWIADRSEDWLAERAQEDAPFFLQMSFPDPHHPFTPPGKYWDMYDPAEIELPSSFGKGNLPPIKAMQRAMEEGTDPRDNQNPFAVTEDEARAIIALTYGMITMIDDAIGRVLKRLEDLGLADNTVVIFTTDHGDYMGDHGLMLKLLLHYQGTIRVPFIWNDPTTPVPANADQGLASSIDIATTILSRAGIQPFNGIQGRDLFLSDPPEAIIVEEDSQRTMTGFDKPQRVRTVVTDRYRMSLREGENWHELYDLESDPYELANQYDDPNYESVRHSVTEAMLRRIINLQDRSPLPAYRA
ncbi:Arylsulfatase [Aliiroseovarius pelagivivens]|uniref:Arylsulfatase n=1 Tax=Aliiroseovarius pelagivivens TaxID=1639690 RepID=A0A2R8AIQ3_9RHOB|nr:sulfatase-like hydrolase/transferase [Aliiroseovarius pelagivivens]SPF75754.1 Arylsulfatase [Aliiroseovarius pelagivivens]